MEDRPSETYERVYLGIAITVTIVWTVATLVNVVVPGHPVPPYANIMMGIVASCFFGGAVIQNQRRRILNDGIDSREKRSRDELDRDPPKSDDDPYEGPGGYYRADES